MSITNEFIFMKIKQESTNIKIYDCALLIKSFKRPLAHVRRYIVGLKTQKNIKNKLIPTILLCEKVKKNN